MKMTKELEQNMAAINEALAELRADGKLKEISETYFGEDISSPK